MKAIRKEPKASNGYNNGDIDELVQMFTAALTWDGNHTSKESRDHLIKNGFAYRREGFTALTGNGKLAALFEWPMPRVWLRRWWRNRATAFNRKHQESAAA